MQKLALKFVATLLCNFVGQIEDKCKEAKRRIKKAANFIPLPATAFYIAIIIQVALSSFFVCIIVTNTEILHLALIWEAVVVCGLIAFSRIVMAIVVPKILDKWT